jgi:hypothetical protein
VVQVRLLVARQVHRDLHDAAAPKLEAERLEVQQPAVARAHRAGDLLRRREVVRLQVDVVGDEQRPHPDDARARRLVHGGSARVGRALRDGADLGAQQLEAAAAHVREVRALGPERGALVEVDGDRKLARDAAAGLVRERDALLDAQAAHRDEGEHVARAHARVLAGVAAEVNQFRRARDDAHRRLDNRVGRRDEGDDRAVVVGVGVRAEHERARDRLDGLGEARDHFGVAPLAEVRHTLDDALHVLDRPAARTPRAAGAVSR